MVCKEFRGRNPIFQTGPREGQNVLMYEGQLYEWLADKNSSPADILVQNWIIGKPPAFDLTVTTASFHYFN